uniref:Pyridoxal phosphate homeostasis protein n=1 Tax=Blastobotrys adeninivorans TaxID=409370 RepID=A0A060T953_BLAAD
MVRSGFPRRERDPSSKPGLNQFYFMIRRGLVNLTRYSRQMSTIAPERASELKANYEAVKAEIERLMPDKSNPPRLVVVSKYKPVEDIKALYDLGHRHFGENYVQELVSKVEALPSDIQWHFIGSLQSNKCKVLAPLKNLYAVETVDSESKCTKLNNARAEEDSKLNVYIQINTSGEGQKSGISSVEEVVTIARHIKDNCPKLNLEGLMTIGSLASSTSGGEENEDFKKLIEYKKEVDSAIGADLGLSMGMSNDYAQAIKQGSTNVRVGSAIFGARKTKEEMKQQ